MNSRHQLQTHPTAHPPATRAFRFGNLLASFHSFSTRSNKISPLFSMTSPLFFTLAKISPSFSHSSQKYPGVTPSLSQLLKFYLKSATRTLNAASLFCCFPIHYSLITTHRTFPIWLLSARPSAQTIDLQSPHAPRSSHGHRNLFAFSRRRRLAPGMA